MRKIRTLLTAAALLGASASLQAWQPVVVAPEGEDSNPGTPSAPVGSLMRACELARATDGERVIMMRGGTYRPDSPLILTPADSNLTIRPWPGEQPVIKGSRELRLTWTPWRDGIMQAEVPAGIDIDMLIVDGAIRPMARYPNFDPDAVRFNGVSADATSPERVKSWSDPSGGFLHAMHVSDWGDFHYRITGRDAEGNLSLEGGWQNNRQYGLSTENRMVENIFEELDAPGEWYFDRKASRLYYYPLENEDVTTLLFESPRLKSLIEMRGSQDNPVRNVTLSGLELTQTARTFMEPYEPLLRSDWTIYRGGTVMFEGTENCALTDCRLHNVGGNGVFFSRFNRNSSVSGSHLSEIGASAICFVGSPDAVRSPAFEYSLSVPIADIDRTSGPASADYPARCTVSDNLIHDIGLFEKQVTGVELSMCSDITVSHNSIYSTPRAGINVSEGTWGGHVIEHNDVFDTVRETGDHGSFNAWGRDRFWHSDRALMDSIVASAPSLVLADAITPIIIRHNRFRCDRGWDIDLDDGASNYRIHDNLCLNGGIKLREGFYRHVDNNILINNTFHPHVWFPGSGDQFTHNIVMSPYQPIRIPDWGGATDRNIFTDSVSLADARARGTDLHSIVADITFADPSTGDYTVSPEATPVFRLGFQNFPMDDFGVISPRLRSLAKRPKMSLPVIASAHDQAEVIVWNGWQLKNLDTLGERSATGMDSERGVYVISHIAFDNPLRDYLRANDVILGFAGRSVDTLSDLLRATESADLSRSLPLTLFRDQSPLTLTIPPSTLH